MFAQNAVGNLTEALIRAENRRRELLESEEKSLATEFTITISRQVGARGTSVAREVGRRLNWPVYDHELVERLAQELHASVREVEEADERPGNWVVETTESLSFMPRVDETRYAYRLRRLLLALGRKGACIIVGRGAAHLLPPVTTLRVRLVAPLEDRVAYMAGKLDQSLQQVKEGIEATQRERLRFVRDHFHRDASDPANYDLVLNVGTLSVPACADLILDALHCRKETPAKPRVSSA